MVANPGLGASPWFEEVGSATSAQRGIAVNPSALVNLCISILVLKQRLSGVALHRTTLILRYVLTFSTQCQGAQSKHRIS